MPTLDELRKEIDQIDLQLAALIRKRFNVSRAVAEYKTMCDLPIAHLDRENAIVCKFLSMFSEETVDYVESVYKTLIRASRSYQYRYQVENGVTSPMIDQLNAAPKSVPIKQVCHQGVAGAWSHLAAKQMYPNTEIFSVTTFEDIFLAINDGRADAGVLPLDNTTAGTVDDVYDLLIRHNCMIQTAEPYPIRHCLVGIEGTSKDTIKTVFSHPQGLSQCSNYIRAHGYQPIPECNTAVAAKQIANLQNPQYAAVASAETAELYGLTVIDEAINDTDCNQTRFVSISKNCVVSDDANRIALAFRLANQSGALANALGLFADHKINLLKISSRPIPNQPWEYSFYVDCAIDGLTDSLYGLLRQLDAELTWVKLLGCYTEANA